MATSKLDYKTEVLCLSFYIYLSSVGPVMATFFKTTVSRNIVWTVISSRKLALDFLITGLLTFAAIQIKVTDVTWKYISYIWGEEYEVWWGLSCVEILFSFAKTGLSAFVSIPYCHGQLEPKVSLWEAFYTCQFIFFLFFTILHFIVFYSIAIYHPNVPLPHPPQLPHCCPCPWVLFPFCLISSTLTSPHHSCHLFSIYKSVSVVLVSSTCSKIAHMSEIKW